MKEYRLYAGAYTDGRPGNGVFFLRFGADGLRAESVCGGVVNTSYVLPVGDRLYAVEELDGEAAVLEFSPAAGTSYKRHAVPGSGLCHIAACGPFLYASGYAGGTLTGLRQADDPADSLAADVHVTPDGRFVYASVRGADCIECFRVLENGGRLEPVGRFSSGGRCPRSFAISPDGLYLAAANQESGNVTVFPRNAQTGALESPAGVLALPQAACVKWAD